MLCPVGFARQTPTLLRPCAFALNFEWDNAHFHGFLLRLCVSALKIAIVFCLTCHLWDRPKAYDTSIVGICSQKSAPSV